MLHRINLPVDPGTDHSSSSVMQTHLGRNLLSAGGWGGVGVAALKERLTDMIPSLLCQPLADKIFLIFPISPSVCLIFLGFRETLQDYFLTDIFP